LEDIVTKGFNVNPKALTDVADDIHSLYQDVSGGTGYIRGNRPDFQKNAGQQSLTDALKSFWHGQDVFADAYGDEGVLTTFQNIESQLKALETSCRNTAGHYQTGDDQSKTNVNQSANDTEV
jgi:hypothetical protein